MTLLAAPPPSEKELLELRANWPSPSLGYARAWQGLCFPVSTVVVGLIANGLTIDEMCAEYPQ